MQDLKNQILNERLSTLKKRKVDVESTNYDALIAEELARVKAELEEKYAIEKTLKVDKLDLEIEALENWLAEEQATYGHHCKCSPWCVSTF